jgi:nucleotide-binding universal stress UspA family protein
MKKIVIGYDGSDEAKDALRLAADLRKAFGAELVVTPVDEIEPYWGDLNLEQLNEGRDDYFRRMFAQASEQLGDSDFKRVVASGSAPAALVQVAEAEKPDVLVVGSSHRAGFAKVLPGSTGDRLLAGSPCAIAIAPKGYADAGENGIRHIGVAYDGQDESALALDAAIDLAGQSNGDLRLITVNHTAAQVGAGRGGMSPGSWVSALREYFEERLAEGLEHIPAGVESSTVIRDGDPAEELAEEGKELDLLVIGSRGYGPIRRVLLGGVAHQVMKSATCPVMVMPRSAEKAQHKAESHPLAEVVV